jgi:hypothetical protein
VDHRCTALARRYCPASAGITPAHRARKVTLPRGSCTPSRILAPRAEGTPAKKADSAARGLVSVPRIFWLRPRRLPDMAAPALAPVGSGLRANVTDMAGAQLETRAPAPTSAPPEAAELDDLQRRIDDLHQMLYRRGGIRPANAAIEELSKLLLLRLKCLRSPGWQVPGYGRIDTVLDPERIRSRGPEEVKAAFRSVVALPEFAGRIPEGGSQSIWPTDEPLRIDRGDVLAEALGILGRHLALGNNHDVLGTAFDVFLRGRRGGSRRAPSRSSCSLAASGLRTRSRWRRAAGRPRSRG